MKPVSIKFKCFGPYMAEQFIDFSQLEKNGIFLICGETGAGKTTILDAMCYALYGKSSGGLRGDISVMRCKLAGKNDETLVEFVFDCGGKRYKFTRSLKYGRKNLNDSHNCMVLEGEEFIPIFENPKATFVNQKAQELIGLSYDQFRQVIILPQGQFEKLLVSDSVEKEKILVSLFHADRWQRIAEELHRWVTERDNTLKTEAQSIALKLKEYGCEDLDALARKAEQTREESEVLQTQLAADRAVLARKRQEQERALLENQAFGELRAREERLGKLLPQAQTYDEEENLLRQADLAERIRPQFTAYQEAKAQKLRAEGLLRQADNGLKSAEQAQRNAIKTQERQEQGRPEQERRKRQITILEEARELYQSLAEKKAGAQAAAQILAGKKAEWERAQAAFAQLETAWNQAVLAQQQAIEQHRQAQQIYLQGIGSTLAQRLQPGEPCPVCGSREHPCLAQSAQGHISDSQLEDFNRAMNQANEDASKALRARSQGEIRRNEITAQFNEAAQAAALAQRDYENFLARRIGGIETRKELEKEIQTLRERGAAFEAAEEQVRRAVNDAQSQYQVALAAVEAARQELTAAANRYGVQAAAWQEALASSGLEDEERYTAADLNPEERQRRSTRLIQYRTDLANAQKAVAEQREAVADKTESDLAGLKRQVQAQEQTCTEAGNRLALLKQKLETMERDREDLARRSEKNSIARVQVDGDLEFANRLRGRTGTGLQRYVLGVMLTSITSEANRLLKNIYGGRYQLFRTNEIAGCGHKGGLELEVYDGANNERRSVTTLSGGEKFLVALSLAIGLSTVVQAQGGGIRLEAMFIDEGFGSLDRESVNDALVVLQGIQRSAGVVGIISHVEQMAETIPARIEIVKGTNGSICRICG